MDDEIYLFGKGLRTDLPTDLHRIAIGNGIDADENVLWPVFLDWVLGQNIDADTLNGYTFEELESMWQNYANTKDAAINSNTNRITNLENNKISGVIPKPTYADLEATTPNEDNSYKVTNDPDPLLNGYYHFEGSTIVKDSETEYQTGIDNNKSDINTGFLGLTDYAFINLDGNEGVSTDIKFKSTEFLKISDTSLFISNSYQGTGATIACFYDENFEFVGNYRDADPKGERSDITISTIPVGSVYVRFTIYIVAIENIIITGVTGTHIDTLRSFAEYTDNKIEDSGGIREQLISIDFNSIINTVGVPSSSSLAYLGATGFLTISDTSLFISNSYQGNTATIACFYDSDQNFIGNYRDLDPKGEREDVTISSIPSGAVYVRFTASKIAGLVRDIVISGVETTERIKILEDEVDRLKAIDDLKSSLGGVEPIQIVESLASMEKTIGSLTAVQRNQRLVITHITDTHRDEIRTQRFSDLINANEVIDFGIHTGDINDNAPDPIDWFTDMVLNSDKIIYPVMGNHEATGYDGVSDGGVVPYMKAKLFDVISSKIGSVNSRNQYYIDTDYGVRVIFMNQWDYLDGGVFDSYYDSCYTQGQIDWLIATLKDAIVNDYPVIIASHQIPSTVIENNKAFYQSIKVLTDPSNRIDGDVLGDIVNAFTNGTAISETYTQYSDIGSETSIPDIVINDSFASSGTFIAFMNGHNHGDYIGYSTKYPTQLILNAPLGSAERFYVGNDERIYSDLPRSEDNKTQDVMNVYIINLEDRNVGVVRFGSDMNYELRSRLFDIYTF